MIYLSKTYETWDEEALTAGTTDDRDFVYSNQSFETVEDVVDEILSEGFVDASSSRFHTNIWYQTTDPDENFQSGEVTYYAFHIDSSASVETQKLIYNLIAVRQGQKQRA